MTQAERRIYLISALLKEMPQYSDIKIPAEESEQKALLRSLFNSRMPAPIAKQFLTVQDAYLQEETRQKGITTLADLQPIEPEIYLWQGDITTLKVDAIINAANSSLRGCFIPCHFCVDNMIHSFSGIQLRLACDKLMKKQGYDEPAGKAKITPAFNLPSRYVLHTVGPIVQDTLTERDKALLASCYRACLELAEQNGIKSLAFCCISTGEFHFPNDTAAKIAIQTVREYKRNTGSKTEVIFNVFKQQDYSIYQKLLLAD